MRTSKGGITNRTFRRSAASFSCLSSSLNCDKINSSILAASAAAASTTSLTVVGDNTVSLVAATTTEIGAVNSATIGAVTFAAMDAVTSTAPTIGVLTRTGAVWLIEDAATEPEVVFALTGGGAFFADGTDSVFTGSDFGLSASIAGKLGAMSTEFLLATGTADDSLDSVRAIR